MSSYRNPQAQPQFSTFAPHPNQQSYVQVPPPNLIRPPTNSITKPVERTISQPSGIFRTMAPQDLTRTVLQQQPQDLTRTIIQPSIVGNVVGKNVNKIVQPLQVVDLKQYEQMWEKRLQELENSYRDQPRSGGDDKVVEKFVDRVKYQEKIVYQSDNSKQDQLMREIDQLKNQIDQLNQQAQDYEDSVKYLKAQVDELQLNLNDTNDTLDKKNQLIQDQQNEQQQLLQQIGQLQNELQQRLEQINQLESDLTAANDDVNQLNNELDFQNEQLDSHKEAIKRINQTVIDKDNNIHQLENELEYLQNINDDIKIYSLLNSQTKDEIKQLKGQLRTSEKTNDDQAKEIKKLLARIEELEGDHQDLQDRHQELQDDFNTTRQQGQSEVATWKNKFIALNKEFHETQEKLMMKEAELENTLKNMQQKLNQNVEVRQSTVNRRSTARGQTGFSPARGSDYGQSVLNESDIAKIEQLTKK